MKMPGLIRRIERRSSALQHRQLIHNSTVPPSHAVYRTRTLSQLCIENATGAKPSRSLCIGAVVADVGRSARPALLAIRSQRYDLVRAALGGSAVKVDVSPRIGWHGAGLEIGPVPNPGIAGSLRQRSKAFAAGRIPADIEIKQVKRAGETLDLEFGRLDLGLSKRIKHAGPHQAHDQPDDRDDDQHLDQGKARLSPSIDTTAAGYCKQPHRSLPPPRLPNRATIDQRADVTRKTSDAAVIPIRHFSMASSNMVVMPARMAARSMTNASASAPTKGLTSSVSSSSSKIPARPR